jgi:hypothetical protein
MRLPDSPSGLTGQGVPAEDWTISLKGSFPIFGAVHGVADCQNQSPCFSRSYLLEALRSSLPAETIRMAGSAPASPAIGMRAPPLTADSR